jgi:hypothetical protein
VVTISELPKTQRGSGRIALIFGKPSPARAVITGARKPGAVMWTLLAYGIAAILIPTIVVLALFRLARLRRAEDVPPAYIDEWASSHELQTPK